MVSVLKTRGDRMKNTYYLIAAALASSLVFATSPAVAEKVNPLMAKEFTDIAGKEGLMLTVAYAPGEASTKHRHNAHVFVYVLEGSVVMQVEGAKPITLTKGQTFYENPNDIHSVSKNASKTKPAKFLVFVLKDKGVPPVLPAK
jgi:quercetin dioxygenase-like cupin family protein